VNGLAAGARRSPNLTVLKLAAFELGPDPSLVLDSAGGLIAANEAAEGLFGQGLALLARAGLRGALPEGSPLLALLARCSAEIGVVRERGIAVDVFGRPPFVADGSATPLGEGAVLLTFVVKVVPPAAERAAEGLQSVVGLGRILAHEIKNPLAGIRGAAQLMKSGLAAADIPLAQLIVDET
jgi:two-component system nitrogen regulation sensor histidine kinase GlnL